MEVRSGERRRLLVIPRDALIRRNGNDFVYVVEDGKARLLPVEIASRSGEYAGVKPEPLAPGMQVVLDGNDRLRPDQAVLVVKN